MIKQKHYKNLTIEPIEVIIANDMGPLDSNVLKYVMRFRLKNGVEDLKKARTYLNWLIAVEELGEQEVVTREWVHVLVSGESE